METQPFTFHRPARQHPLPVPGTGVEVVVAAPPARASGAGTSWLASLLPVAASAGSVGVLLLLPVRRGPLLVAAVAGMVLLSVAAGLAPRLRDRRIRARDRARYLAYLDGIRSRASQVAAAQRSAAEHLHPDLPGLLALVGREERLWERRPVDHDFLSARVGRGPVDLACPVRLETGGPLAEHDPELLAAAEELVAGLGQVAGVPVTLGLRDLGVVAVTGPPERARALARALVCQLAAVHAPDDLRLLAWVGAGGERAWDWLKWLPHTRVPLSGSGPGPPTCLLASDPARLGVLLEAEVGPRLGRLGGGASPTAGPWAARPAGERARPAAAEPAEPHLVVVVDGFSRQAPEARPPMFGELLERAAEAGVTVLCLAAGRADEPAELGARIRISEGGDLEVAEAGPDGRRGGGVAADHAGLAWCEAIARRMAPLRLDRREARPAALPASVRLLELLAPAGCDLAHPASGWRPRPRVELLRVPIGVRPGGDPVVLDLKEAADGGMGPHGLVVGATGSGKSELLRTMVAGLAVAHPPELLSFVFVDFKGGAAFADLAGLPHVAGMITNLQDDLTMVDRMRAALSGEQQRRQRLLRQAGNLEGIGQYQARRAVDHTLPPMPYLVVVVDEFGELLASRPDFLDLFVTMGRVGRSLGIHLVLASQQLDEGRVRGLEGHLRYRICLRTFGPAESSAVLGTPDAYHLPPTPGAGWLKVDTAVYQRFQAARVAVAAPGPAAPPRVVPFAPLRSGTDTDTAGRPPRAAGGPEAPASAAATDPLNPPSRAAGGPERAPVLTGGPERAPVPTDGPEHAPVPTDGPEHAPVPTDVEAVVAALASEARRAGRRAHQVWLPPLPPAITLSQILRLAAPATVQAASGPPPPGQDAGWLRAPVGLVDRPAEQARQPLVLDFSGGAGHLALVGAPRSGKSTLLCTIVAALALAHPPAAVQLYCIDLGGGLLHQLARLPHVGAVCARGENDRIRRLARQLHALVADRQLLFRRCGIDSMAAFHRRRELDGLPDDGYGEVFLVVDNWALLRQELADAEADLAALAATGLHYGVHLVVAANRWADLRASVRDHLGGRLELRLNDPVESELGRAAASAVPALPGRGLTATGHQFQAALPQVGAGGERGLARAAAGIAALAPPGPPAPPLRLLPDLVRADELPSPGAGQPPGVPFAIEERRLELVRLDLFAAAAHFLVLGDAGCGKTSLLRLLARGLAAGYGPDRLRLLVVDYRRTLVDAAEGPHLDGYASSPAMAGELAGRLRRLLAERLPSAPLSRGELLARGWWTGPSFVLLVDDYDLLPTTGGNPLAPLVDLLGQGRDVGLHLVVARPVGGAARTAFEPVLQRLRELGTPGLLMRGDSEEGVVLGGRKAGPLPPGRGWLVRRDAPGGLVQVAYEPARPAAQLRPVPGVPPTPGWPGAAGRPGTPGTPDRPGTPGTPGRPRTPGAAGTPDRAGPPGTLGTPGAPGTPLPASSAAGSGRS
jgi:S-DNA-T family DNA segregation ATPase FtsK/SpoIIIE